MAERNNDDSVLDSRIDSAFDRIQSRNRLSTTSPRISASYALNPDIKNLCSVIQNEKVAPELLPFETELVSKIESSLREQQNAMATNESVKSTLPIIKASYQLDIDRTLYMLTSYYRTRIFKLQKNVFDYHELISQRDPSIDDLFSAEELSFIVEYYDNKRKNLEKSCEAVGPLKESELVDSGDSKHLQHFVYMKVLENIGSYNIASENEERQQAVDLTENAEYLINYDYIKRFVKEKKIQLA
jgi:GINS complex subunit 4